MHHVPRNPSVHPIATRTDVTLVKTNPIVRVLNSVITIDRLEIRITAADAPSAIAAAEYAVLSIWPIMGSKEERRNESFLKIEEIRTKNSSADQLLNCSCHTTKNLQM